MTTTAAPPPLLEDTLLGAGAGGLYRRQNIFTGLGLGIVLGFIGFPDSTILSASRAAFSPIETAF